MTIFLYELKRLEKSIIIWSISVMGLLLMYMGFFPSVGGNAEIMDKMLENYPEEMLKALGMNTGLSISTVLGYFAFVFVFIQILLAVQAANYGFSILSIEERELTADFLMTKPVSRTHIILSKFFAAFTALCITNLFTWGAAFLSLELFNDGKGYEIGPVVLLLSSMLIFQLCYLSIGMVISVSVNKIRSVLSYSMALAFGTYMINAIRGILDSDLLGIFTPYYYFEPNYILEQSNLNGGMVAISLAIIVMSLVASYILYRKRNIHSL
jgi:ABC-2 type transport system permease protein